MMLDNDIQKLYASIAEQIKKAKIKVAVAANSELALLYWNVGKSINDFVLQGNRAAYGKEIIANLARKLTANFGKGWGEKQIRHCLRAAESFSEEQIVYALRRQLTWTHLKTIAYEENPLKRQFYLELAISQHWNTRTLSEQIDKMLFERTAIAKQPEEIIKKEIQNLADNEELDPELIFKNTYILDFLNLPLSWYQFFRPKKS